MKNKIIKLNIIFLTTLFINGVSFASTYEKPNVLMGPNSINYEDIYLDDRNYALESLSKIMTKEDTLKAYVYVSEYRKGNKDIIENLVDLIRIYNPNHAQFITNYIINDNNIKLKAAFSVNHMDNSINYYDIYGLTEPLTAILKNDAEIIWNKFINYVPEEFHKNIDYIYLEEGKHREAYITICEVDDNAEKWSICFDVALAKDENYEQMKELIIHNTVYYYILRADQVEMNKPRKGNYVYRDRVYKDDSYINLFYKKFWKQRRKEINSGQFDLYPEEFFNSKASKTVYDDMAVSFVIYMLEGVSFKNDTKFTTLKRNFFNDFEVFKSLALFYRIKEMNK